MNPFQFTDPREIRRQAMLAGMRQQRNQQPTEDTTMSNMNLKQLADDVWRVTAPSGPHGTMQIFTGSLAEATSAAAKALAERALVTGFHGHGEGSGISYDAQGKVIAPEPVLPAPEPALVVAPEPDRPLFRPLQFVAPQGAVGAGIGVGDGNIYTPGAGR